MNRYRWFRAEWPISMRVLAKRLKAKQFGDGVVDGFVIDRVRDDFLEARYVERFELEEVVRDPFGRELTFQRVEFRQTAVRATSGKVGLELQDAPRGTHGLVSRLAEVNDFSLAIVPISVDVLAWAAAFQRSLNVDAFVDSLQVGALELEAGIHAKVVIKGPKDVRRASRMLTDSRRHTLEKIQLRIDGRDKEKVILTHQGAAAVGSDRSDRVAIALREALAGLLK